MCVIRNEENIVQKERKTPKNSRIDTIISRKQEVIVRKRGHISFLSSL